MHTELQNIKQQVDSLQENIDLITQDIVRILPNIVSLLSENEKKMKEFYEIRAKDQEVMTQLKGFIKRENDILTKIINDYGSLQDVANEISTTARQELVVLSDKEKEIVSKISEIPEKVNIKYQYGIDIKSTPVVIVMVLLTVIISLGLGALYEKNSQIDKRKSYEMRYRMMELELPNATSNIDSSYNLNPDKFHDLVIKKEEQQRLKWSIKEKQREILELQN
ncbi:hypothetical protein [Sphingobacterium bovistauri]|uniref:Uncharacterized protein n=1 Tax=Sphingobacterium bovistauri TaxID=2781959 RepID=A0ABS7Z763_9SPHI|nr:hypothetical protein [Sphingobacterium bovistauri]MCA5004794.1 hypothetical protein [Sphingobacterium bovistauri]